MKNVFSVGFVPQATDQMRTLVASLQNSFRPIEVGQPDVVLIAGTASWAARALAIQREGSPRILVLDPEMDDPDAIHELAERVERNGAHILLSEGFAHDPALLAMRHAFDNEIQSVDVRGWDTVDPKAQALIHLRTLRSLAVENVQLEVTLASGAGMLVAGGGLMGGREISLRLCATLNAAMARQHTAVLTGSDIAARIILFGGDNARPAEASWISANGLQIMPAIYETGHRVNLRMLADGAIRTTAEQLMQFAADAEQVAAAFS